MAATFCWDFRYALVPIFGPDFPDLCEKPGSDAYSTMVISQKIILQCTKDIEVFRSMQHKLVVQTDDTSFNLAKDTDTDKPGHDGQQYHNNFRPINRPTTMSIETPMDNRHGFLRTPTRTPNGSCFSSPATTSQSFTNPSAGLRRLQIPCVEFFDRDRPAAVSSSSSNSPESSDSEVSPKTTRRKRGFCKGTRAQIVSHSLQTFAGNPSNEGALNQADIHAAQILLDLRTAV